MFGPNVGMEKKVLEVFGSFEPGCGVVLFNIVISFLYVESILFYPLVEKNRIYKEPLFKYSCTKKNMNFEYW